MRTRMPPPDDGAAQTKSGKAELSRVISFSLSLSLSLSFLSLGALRLAISGRIIFFTKNCVSNIALQARYIKNRQTLKTDTFGKRTCVLVLSRTSLNCSVRVAHTFIYCYLNFPCVSLPFINSRVLTPTWSQPK
jgi:hypothetical protein